MHGQRRALMFEASLKAKIKKIFDLDKVTYDSPSESHEQEGVFIEVENARTNIRDKKCIAKVTGKLRIFAQGDKMPFTYFMQKIDAADPDDKKDIFFFDFISAGKLMNLDERTISFVFFFNSQYNPNLGTINEVNITVGET
jgi:hypothetical protein